MKKLPYIIGIPLVAILLVLGGAMVWKLKTQTPSTVTTAPSGTLPNNLGSAKGNTPTNPFSGLFGQKTQTTPIPTPTPASVAAMNADVNAIGDDGGAADFSSLQTQVNGL